MQRERQSLLHNHKEYELNFVENGAGVRRIVGDSVEEIGDYDLVLLCGDNLEHVWEQGNCQSKQIREITIQFSPDLFSNNFIDKKQFTSFRKMLDNVRASSQIDNSYRIVKNFTN